MSEYFMVLLIAGIVPVIASFIPSFHIYRRWRSLLLTFLGVLLIFGIWDVVAVARGHWYFNPSKVWTARFYGLPIEEIIFFIAVPFYCIVAWETLRYIKKTWF